MQKNNVFCSICTMNHTSYAGVLNESLQKAGHKKTHFVLIVDYDVKYKEIIEKFGFKPVFLQELAIPKVDELIRKYSAFELSNVLKPFFIEWLLQNHTEIKKLVYLDTDIYVYSPLNEIFDYLDKNPSVSTVLIPHIIDYEAYGNIPDYSIERLIMPAGLYNGGFYAMKNDRNSLQFLDWHKRKLFNYGYNGQNAGMFVDQKILDFAPILFEYVGIYRNKSYNVAHWNYYERPIEYKNNTYFIKNKKLAFFHFSQLKIDTQDIAKSLLFNISIQDKPVLQKMVSDYWVRLKEHGYENIINIPYAYQDKYKEPLLSFVNPLLAKTKELDSTKTNLNSAKTELDLTKTQLDSTKIELDSTKVQLDLTKTELDSIKTERDSIKGKLDSNQSQLELTKTKLNSVNAKLDSSQSRLELTKAELGSVNEKLDSTKTQLESVQSQLDSIKTELSSTRAEIGGIYFSREWKAALILRKVADRLIPKKSLRRKTAVIFWRIVRLPLRLFLKAARKTKSESLFYKNCFCRFLKPKKRRKINTNSKKIVFIGHSYHNKTKSTAFLIDYLKKFYDVKVIQDESWLGRKSFPDLSFINGDYLGVIFFQNLPSQKILKNIKNDNLIFFPMYDAVGADYNFWKNYKNLKVINFSKTLHDKLAERGFNSMHIQYFPKPQKFIAGHKDEVFFWQRLARININTVTTLLGKDNLKIHIHKAVDPNYKFIQPDRTDEKRFQITYSDWFETREEMWNLIKQKSIYIAPRELEGIGLSFLEAMAMGKAVIAVDNPTMNEYIEHNKTGYLFDLSNPRKIDLSNIEQVQKNTHEFMQKGYAEWEKNKHRIVEFIL